MDGRSTVLFLLLTTLVLACSLTWLYLFCDTHIPPPPTSYPRLNHASRSAVFFDFLPVPTIESGVLGHLQMPDVTRRLILLSSADSNQVILKVSPHFHNSPWREVCVYIIPTSQIKRGETSKAK